MLTLTYLDLDKHFKRTEEVNRMTIHMYTYNIMEENRKLFDTGEITNSSKKKKKNNLD